MKELEIEARDVKVGGEAFRPRATRSWAKVNEKVKGLKPGRGVEFVYPEGGTDERRVFRMVVIGAGHRYHGAGRVGTRTEGDRLRVWLKD